MMFFDYEDGDFIHIFSDSIAMDSDGHMMTRMDDSMAWIWIQVNYISFRDGWTMRTIIESKSTFSIFLLYGCSVPQANNIETLKGWSFLFNEGTNDFSLFFGLLDKNGDSVCAEVDVDIRIVNENNEEVYRATKAVSKSDSVYYTSQIIGEQFLANVRIPASDN